MVLCRSGTRSNTGRTEQRGRRDTARTQAWPLHRHPNHRVPSYVRVGGGFACAIQPHREVKPESGLSLYEILDMKACRITTLFWGRGGGRGGGKKV